MDVMKEVTLNRIGCASCVYVLYHPRGEGKVCPCDGCLGTGDKNLYLHYVPGDGIKARIDAEHSGKCNIVIGGSGEHEVNAKWSIEKAYKKLAYTCEQVGFCVTHKNDHTLELVKSFEPYYYHLEWKDGKLHRITKVLEIDGKETEKDWWIKN